jgi:hypothetical protein
MEDFSSVNLNAAGADAVHRVSEKLAKTVNVVSVEASKLRASLILTLKNLKLQQNTDLSGFVALFMFQEYAFKQLIDLIKSVSLISIHLDEDYMRKQTKRKKDRERWAANKVSKFSAPTPSTARSDLQQPEQQQQQKQQQQQQHEPELPLLSLSADGDLEDLPPLFDILQNAISDNDLASEFY